jgi:hypothetical protein
MKRRVSGVSRLSATLLQRYVWAGRTLAASPTAIDQWPRLSAPWRLSRRWCLSSFFIFVIVVMGAVMWHRHLQQALTAAAFAVLRLEGDLIHPAGALARPFGAEV